MCAHIIVFQERELWRRRRWSDAVRGKYPEKEGYIELCIDIMKFVFYETDAMEGVTRLRRGSTG